MTPPATPQPPLEEVPARGVGGPGARSPGRARPWAALGLLLALALFLRLAPIQHGGGANYLADTHVVRSALGMAKDKDLVPEVGKYSTYPNLLPYALLPIYGAQYALGRLDGSWGGPGEYGHKLLERPALAHLPARVLVAILSAMAVWVVVRWAKDSGLKEGAYFAGYLLAAGLLHMHFSVQERPWAPMVLFLLLSALYGGRATVSGRGRDLLLSALWAGFAFATHQGGLLAAGIPAIAFVLAPWRRGALRQRIACGARAGLVFLLVALAVGHPYLLVHGATATEQVAAGEALQELGGPSVSVGGQAMRFAFSLHTLERLSKALFGYDPLLVVLGVLGMWAAWKRPHLRAGLLFAAGWGGFFLLHYNDHVRYLLPLAAFLCLPAGAFAQWMWRRRGLRAVLLLLAVLPLIQCLRLVHLLRQEDTRNLALAALVQAPPAKGIAVDVFGPEVPQSRASLERLAQWRDLGARERHRLLWFQSDLVPPDGAGISALPVDALLEFEIRRRSSRARAVHQEELSALGPGPTEWFAALGLDEVLLADRAPADGVPSVLVDAGPADGGLPKLPPLRVGADPLWVIDPSRIPGGARGARLPTEVDFALLDLWQVERPGPRLERRALAP